MEREWAIKPGDVGEEVICARRIPKGGELLDDEIRVVDWKEGDRWAGSTLRSETAQEKDLREQARDSRLAKKQVGESDYVTALVEELAERLGVTTPSLRAAIEARLMARPRRPGKGL